MTQSSNTTGGAQDSNDVELALRCECRAWREWDGCDPEDEPERLRALELAKARTDAVMAREPGARDHDIVHALMSMPCRRDTFLPELVRYFKRLPGGELRRYLKSFAGLQFEVPAVKNGKPKALFPSVADLDELERDEAIAKAMGGARPSTEDQLRICMDHKVTWAHLREIHRAVYGKVLLSPPTNGTLEGKIAGAATLLRAHPGSDRWLCEMFEIKVEHVRQARAMVQKR